jgi:hypothetical protein
LHQGGTPERPSINKMTPGLQNHSINVRAELSGRKVCWFVTGGLPEFQRREELVRKKRILARAEWSSGEMN